MQQKLRQKNVLVDTLKRELKACMDKHGAVAVNMPPDSADDVGNATIAATTAATAQ